MTTWRIFPAALAALGLAGCGDAKKETPSIPTSGPPATSAPSSTEPVPPGVQAPTSSRAAAPVVDACTLVTKEEAAAILGALREDPKHVVTPGPGQGCSYMDADGASLSLRVYGVAQWDMQKGIEDAAKVKPIQGVGDEAYYTMKGSDTDLWARKGGAVLNVNGSAGVEKARKMAEKALGRL